MKKKGSYRIILKRLLVAVLIIVMLFELSVTPNAPLASIYAKALETAAAIETSTEAPVFEPLDEADLAATQDATVAEAVGEGEGQPDEAALGAANEGEQPVDAAGAGDGQAQTGDAAAAAPSEAPQAADAAAGAPSEGTQPAEAASVAPSPEAQPAEAASVAPSETPNPDAATNGASSETPNPDAATNGASTETAADAASTASSAEVLPADAAASASSGEVKPEDAAASASSGASLPEEAATSASSGASLPDDAATSASSGEKKEEEEKPEGIEGELYAEEGILKLTFGKDAGIPEGCEVAAYEVTSENEGYESYVNKALEKTELASESIASLKVLDISVRKDDEEIQPEDSVNIEISAESLFGEGALYSDDEVRVVHINGEDGDVLECEVISGEDEEGTDATTQKAEGIRFSTGSFSPFVVMHLVSEKSVKATDDASYEVVASYDNTSGIPAGTELKVNEIWQDGEQMAAYWQQSAALLDEAVYSLEAIRAFDISFVDRETGDVYQPGKDINVSIKLLSNGIIEGAEPKLVRFGEQAEIIDTGFEDQCVSFGTSSLTVYGISQFAVKKTLTAGDGSSYLVTVNYDSVSGIPEGAVLSVSEITENDENFDDYAEKSSEQLEESGPVEVVRAFDICIRNPETGEEYQPTKPIQVSIDIFDENLEERSEDLDIVHIHGENEEQTDVVESAVNDGVVEFETEGFSVYVVVRKVIEQVLTASDGKEYQITVSFDSTCGIPENAQLSVSEIKEDNAAYEQYVEESAQKLSIGSDVLSFARAFDITLKDPETGEEYQPNKDVKVSIKLLNEEISEELRVGVVHFGKDTEVVESEVKGEAVEFETGGFSVYVVIAHEKGEVVAPRVEFHFIDRYTDEQYAADIDVTQATTAAPYNFVNTHGEYQTSQIIKDGEALELINDPSNISVGSTEKFFYGWYIVSMNNDNSTYNADTHKYSGEINFNWPTNPDQIKFEQPISITMPDGSTVGSVNIGDSLKWTINGVSRTGTVDASGSIHVYLAPLYEDFFFINFHSNPRSATGAAASSLMTRKLVVFGAGTTSSVRIGNVLCESPDPQHKMFAGWECDVDGNGTIESSEYYQTVQHVLDQEGNIANEEVNSAGHDDGYYITVNKPARGEVTYMDLYPVFDEARWLYFNRGLSGNNASYVGAAYRLTNDNKSSDGTLYYFDNEFFKGGANTIKHISTRPGYDFDGWYLFANMNQTTGEITNLTTAQDVTFDYIGSDNQKHTATINTTAIKVVDGKGVDGQGISVEGNILSIGTWYVSSTGVISQTETAGCSKLFEVDGGNLRFYKAMNEMTLTAKWKVKQGTYRVIIWKQKVTDDKNATNAQKTYDFDMFYTSNEVPSTELPNLTQFSGSYVDANGTKQTVNNANLQNRTYTGFHYSHNDVAEVGNPLSDGTTVYNVYYDRDFKVVNFYYNTNQISGNAYFNSHYDTAYTYTINNGSGTRYGIINDKFVQLRYEDGMWKIPEYGYVYTVDNTNGTYGKVGDEYYLVTKTVESQTTTHTWTYTKTTLSLNSSTSNTDGLYYLNGGIYTQIRRAGGNWYLYSYTTTTDDSWWNTYYGLVDYGDGNQIYVELTAQDWGAYFTLSGGEVYTGQRYTRSSSNTRVNNNNPPRYQLNTGSQTNNSYSHDSTRYTRSGSTFTAVSPNTTTGTLYGLIATNIYAQLSHQEQTTYTYKYTYLDSNGDEQIYTGNTLYTRSYTTTGNYLEYTGPRFQRTSSNYNRMVTWTGLYEQTFAQNGYNWDVVAPYSWSDGSLIQTLLDAFIESANPYNLTCQGGADNNYVYHYKQQLDGKYYQTEGVTRFTARVSSGNFQFSNKFQGFEVSTYNTGNNGYNINGGSSNATGSSSSRPLHIYHVRKKYEFTFDVNYPIDANLTYSGGKSQNITVADIYFEAPLNTYGSTTNEGITHWYYGVVNSTNTADIELKGPDHYVFGGWYEDQSCTIPFNFNSTMPVGNKMVYAKWDPERFVILIDPNGGELDHVNHGGYSSFGTGTVTIDGQSYTYNFPALDTAFSDQYPLPGASAYNSNALQTYIRSRYGNQLVLYDPARRYVAMSDRVAAEYTGTVYYYVNFQWRSTDGASGMHNDIRSALYLTASQLNEFYNLYRNIVILSLGSYASSNEGMVLLDFDTWKSLYVAPEKYRPLNANETWTFLGWYKTPINDDGSYGTEDSMPYNVNDPVTGRFKLTAHWRLDGGYSIQYVPQFTMPDGAQINGTMPSWRDPVSSTLTYADGAKTEIYKAPTGLTKDGEPVIDDSVIFRGWALVSKTGTESNPIYTQLEPGTYYFPSDDYTVNAANAGSDNNLYFQAIYQYKNSSDRRPKVTNLTLDANLGFVNTISDNALPALGYPGTHCINNTDHLDSAGRPTQILFGDFQSSTAIHLYKYATKLTQAADGSALTDSHQFFEHPNGYFLLGFDNNPTEGDYIATYPADSVIAVTRDDNKTIYGVWEPMVYVTFENKTGVTANPVTFGLQSTTGEALEVINVRDGMYDRHPLSDYSTITLNNNQSLTLAFPKGAEKKITISGTNTLGVGKKLIWNSSIDLVNPDGTTTRYSTTDSATGNVSYTHTADGNTHSHTLECGEVNNTKAFSFNAEMIVNENPLTITFTRVNNRYAMLLDDNYPGGGMQEFDYDTPDIQPENGVPKTQALPITSTRIGYSFVGWAYSSTATEPDYSATSPASNPWTILDLNNTNGGFFSETVEIDEVLTRTLYAVWKVRTDAVYIYKDVPEPGNQELPFTFTVSITGTYNYNSNTSHQPINVSDTFKLIHGEYLQVKGKNYNPTSGGTQTAYVQATVEVYSPVKNTDGTTSYVKDDDRSKVVRWELNVTGDNHNNFSSLLISASETSTSNYDTSVTISAESDDKVLKIGNNTYNKSELPKTVATNTVTWTNTDTGGTIVFENKRQTYDVKVTKTLESNTTASTIFNYTAFHTETFVNLDGATVTRRKNLDAFNVTSGSNTILHEIPAGVSLTITEATDTNDNYKTYCKVDGGAETEGKSCTAFTVGVNPADSGNKQHLVAFRNVLKSYKVTFKLVDQDKNTTINGMFSLASAYGSLGTDLYASSTSVNPPAGVFYTGNKFWVGTYTLAQKTVAPKYLGLTDDVTITVTGNGDKITTNNEYVTVEGNETDGFVILVKNWRYAEINLKAGLLDPMVNQRTFVFGGTYKLNGKTYDLNRKLITNGVTPATFELTAYSTDDGEVSSSQLPITLKIPVGATQLTISEDTSQVTIAPDTIATTYDTTVKYKNNSRVSDNKYVYQVAIATEHDGDTIAFYNVKKTVNITLVKKVVEMTDTSGTFSFTITLLNGANPIANYPIHDINGTPMDPTDDEKTFADGTRVYTLSHNGTIVFSIPVGARFKIQETGVTARTVTEENTLEFFSTTTETTLSGGTTPYTGTTLWDEDTRLYTLWTAPSTPLTVTVSNGPGGKEVFFIKTNGFGHEDTTLGGALAGAKFSLYDTAAHAETGGATGLVNITVNNLRVTEVTSTDTFDAVNHCNVDFKVRSGIYYMKEVNTVPGYEQNKNIYRVVVGKTVATQNGITLPAGSEFLIQLYKEGAVEEIPDIAKHGIINISKTKRTVILKKVNSAEAPVPGAKFDIHYVDKAKMECEAENYSASSLDNGAFFVGKLPFGYYYLHETQLPSGAAADRWFKLTVTADVVKLEDSTEPD